MANISLKFPRRTLRLLLVAVVIIVGIIVVSDVSGSLLLNNYLRSFQREVNQKAGVRLDFSAAFFDVFTGVHIKGLKLTQGGLALFSARMAACNFDVVQFISQKRLSCKKITLCQPYIYKTDRIDKEFITAILLGMQAQENALRSTVVKIYDFNMMDLVTFDMDGYVAFAQAKLLLTRGKLKVKKTALAHRGNAMADSPLGSDVSYAFEATYQGNDFLIHKLELTGYGAASLLLSGAISDFTGAVDLEIEGDIRSVLLDDIPRLNNRYFSTHGFADVAFHVHGPVEQPACTAEVKFTNCNFSLLNSLYIKKIRSELTWDGKDVAVELSGYMDDSFVNLRLKTDKENAPHIRSEVSIKDWGSFRAVVLNFQGYFLNRIIGGDVEAIFDYVQKKTPKRASAAFRNVYFNFDTSIFQSNSFDMAWTSGPSQDEKKPTPRKTMSFADLRAVVESKDNAVALKNIKAALYGGLLEGDAHCSFDVNEFAYDAKLSLRDLKIKDFCQEFLSLGYQLSGSLSGALALSSEPKKAISGEVEVTGGKVYDNVVLTAVADFFGVPSLRTIDFTKLRINFLRAWDKYRAGINLFADDVTLYLDNQFFDNGVMNGYLSVRIDSKRMNESRRFKRLFKYIEYKEPTVYFPFNLKGYLENPRIEWLQNEFKEKLEKFLSDKHKKILQDHLNSLAKDFMK